METKPGYESYQLNGKFYKQRGFYFMFMPFSVPYNKISTNAIRDGYNIQKGAKDVLIEHGTAFGFGWIAIPVEDSTPAGGKIIELDEEMVAYEHKGPYVEMRDAYKKVMSDYPEAKNFFNIYLNSPNTTKTEELRTLICFN